MAIQMRRGSFSAFLPSKLKPGEFAVVLSEDENSSDGRSVYIAFAAGVAKRLATYTDMVDSCKTAISESVADIAASLTAKVTATDNSIKTAEAGRVSAEKTRVSNENTRVSNENTRKTAEASRVTETATAIADCNEAAAQARGSVGDLSFWFAYDDDGYISIYEKE